jgi:hypothetical protein
MAGNDQIAAAFLAAARSELALCRRRLEHCAGQLDDEQLWSRSDEGLNSIANLLMHVTGNLGERLLSVVGGRPYHRDRQAEFDARGPLEKERILQPLADVFDAADAVLASLPADQLLKSCTFQMLQGSVQRDATLVIVQTLVHLGGHTQEIVTLTRQLLGERYRFLQPPRRIDSDGGADKPV